MSLAGRLYRNEVQFDFMRRRKRWYVISTVAIGVCLLSLIFRGFTLGIDFKGGAQFEFPRGNGSVELAGEAVERAGVEAETVQSLTAAEPRIRVQTGPLDEAEIQRVTAELRAAFGTDDISTSTVGSSWGESVTRKAIQGLVVFLILVVIYISLRFEPKMAFAAIVSLIHDLVITAGVYSMVGFEVTPATVIALLSILGFSLYDTVVVFDKVRENTAGIAQSGKRTFGEATNAAVNETLMRSINTSIIALMPVAALLFIGAGLLGAGTLKDLALAQLVGLAAGAYSSIFIAAPLLVDLKEREPEMKALAARVARSRQAEASRGRGTPRAGGSPAAEAVTAATATGVLDRPRDLERDAETFDADADGREDAAEDIRLSKPVPGRQVRPGQRPAKRGRPGRPSGKRKR